MKIIIHDSITGWGEAIYVMESKGRGFGKYYTYSDDKKTCFLSDLSVSPKARKKGLGLKIQETREDIGRKNGYKYSCLWVKKGSWMRKWYARRSYKYYTKHTDSDYVWLRKKL